MRYARLDPAPGHDLPDWLSPLAMAAAAATPGPWTIVADGSGRLAVHATDSVIERDLSEPFARYILLLRESADTLLAASPRRWRFGKAWSRAEVERMDAILSAVKAEWVFVAPNGSGGRYFLHDCVRKVGAASIDRGNALFLDAAKSALLASLALQKERIELVAPPQGARVVSIPRRVSRGDVAAEYGAFAANKALHALSGRNELPERTAAMTAAILRHMDFGRTHRVLDIGCGDASLLRSVSPYIAKGVGTVLTESECQRLVATPGFQGIDFFARSFEIIGTLQGPFDRIIANGCLHFVRTRVGAERALRAIHAMMTPGGKLWVGELHARDRPPRLFASKFAALRHVKARHGVPFAVAFARYLWRRRHRADVVVEPPSKESWCVKPEEFTALATRCGFVVEGLWTCWDLTGDTFYTLQDRYACLLSKP